MATITIKIDPESKKARYLLGLINELAKTDKGIVEMLKALSKEDDKGAIRFLGFGI